MKQPTLPFSAALLLLATDTASAWSRTDHWTTTVITTTSKKLFTSSIPVYPTGSPLPKPISSNVSISTLTTDQVVPIINTDLTYLVTVTDFFYDPAKTSGLCIQTGFRDCSPAPSFGGGGFGATSSITTNYYAPMVVSNPESCTLISYEYSTRQVVDPARLDREIPGAATQATQSEHALTVTTWISTKSTNLGGQAVTQTVVDVYLKEDAVDGVVPAYELAVMSECVDPRQYSCSVSSSLTPGVECLTTGQTYPPTEASETAGGATNTGTPVETGAPGSGKPDAAPAGVEIRMGLVLGAFVAVGVGAVLL